MRSIVRDTQQAIDFVRKLKFTGKPLQITVKQFKRDRTLPQNAKLHAMIRDLSLHTGYTENEMKEIVKAQYGTMKTVRVGDKTVTIPKPTSEYNVEECNIMLEHLYQLGAEINCAFTESP